jgi:hypothetical protein
MASMHSHATLSDVDREDRAPQRDYRVGTRRPALAVRRSEVFASVRDVMNSAGGMAVAGIPETAERDDG